MSIVHAVQAIALESSRSPRHGRMQEFRRRVVGEVVRRLLPPTPNQAGHGSLPAVGIQRILVCRPNHRLGNTVLTTPLIVELERRYPGAEVDVLGAGPATASIFAAYARLGELYILDRRAIRHPWATLRILRALRKKRYDLVIDAASGSSSGRVALAIAKSRFQLRVDARAGKPAHMAARPVQALRYAMGIDTDESIPPLDLRLSATELERGRATLEQVLEPDSSTQGPVLAVFPNATGTKRYDRGWWMTFLSELDRVAGPFRIVELVAADGLSRLENRYPAYFTSDPRKLAAFIDAAGLYISADCGVMHLAAATSAQTIGLFARTDPHRYAPYGRANAAVWSGDVDATVAAQRVAGHLLRRRERG